MGIKLSHADSSTIKTISIILDILVPTLVYWSLINHHLSLSWVLLGMVIFIRLLIFVFSK